MIWQRVMRLCGTDPLEDGEDPPDRFYLTQLGVSYCLFRSWLLLGAVAAVLMLPPPIVGERIADGSGFHVGVSISGGIAAFAMSGLAINVLRFVVVYSTCRRYGSWRIWKEGGPVPAPWLRRLIEPSDFDFIAQGILAIAAALSFYWWGASG